MKHTLSLQNKANQKYHLSAMLVHEALDVNATSTCALVKDGKLWLVIEQSGHLPTEIMMIIITKNVFIRATLPQKCCRGTLHHHDTKKNHRC